MKLKKGIAELWELLEPVVASEGMEIIEMELQREPQGYVLRIYIDHPDGVTIEDCTRVSRVVGDYLDVIDPIDHAYHLEVSSPGVDRPLRKVEHFARYLGSVVRVRTTEVVEGRKNFKGILVDVKEDTVTLECDGHAYDIPIAIVGKARLLYFETENLRSSGRGRKKQRIFDRGD
ncbi:ribosome maturation factor RimP [Thermodesulforhabdus norvegica]|uniref:Ribosome maturation factor RimP n=1 Tax=Thermodesulforhabdus norvegica TaxID=39841 RepID=A0A1I4VM86_9BACT|nr:ribosome maturation factor RimP [Thermodesulforhabdus norvegica]SFN02189.1 ribosome maturation factor RimP [Thermodesulforhabdus norvegica]